MKKPPRNNTDINITVEAITKAFEDQESDIIRHIADCLLEIKRMKEFRLPQGKGEDRHYLWDKIKIRIDEIKTLRGILKMCFDKFAKEGRWPIFCDELAKGLYQLYRKKRYRLTEVESPFGGPKYPAEVKEPFIDPGMADIEERVEWIIRGMMVAKAPFYFGTSEQGTIENALLVTPDGLPRLPRSALRGILRRDLKIAFRGAGCEVDVGTDRPCPCPVCKVMRKITLMDSVAENLKDFIPEMRKRIRINPISGTVSEGALFDMEVGPEDTKFPFEMRVRTKNKILEGKRDEEIPDELRKVLGWWRKGLAFLSGEAGTGKGIFSLQGIEIYRWDLIKGIKDYIENYGFRGGDIKSENIPESLKKEDPENIIPITDNEFPYISVTYNIEVDSPLLLNDPIRANVWGDGRGGFPDAVFFKKYKIKADGTFDEGVTCFKAESIRGVFRTAFGRQKNLLTFEHEDCPCLLCKLFGSVHEAGMIRFEDLEIENTFGSKILDHVAIDRFMGGAKEKFKFDDEPLIGTPEKPIRLEGKFWIKQEAFNSEDMKKTFKDLIADIASGCYTLGSKGSIGYGWIKSLEVTDGPEWLKGKYPQGVMEETRSLRPINIIELLNENEPRFTFVPPEIDEKTVYFPYSFIQPLSSVKRVSNPTGHDNWEKISGQLICKLKILTPLIIPDTSPQGVKTDENGHPTYRFFRLGNNVAIPGSEIRGMISSVYEAVTNSCFRIFDEKRYISWRMEPEEFVGNSDKGITGYKPGIVKEINGKLKVFKVMAYRLPLYDYLNITEKIKFEDYKSQFNYIRYGKRRLCNALKVNNKIAEAAKKNLKYLKDLMDKDKNSLIELLCGRKEIIFKEECVNYVKDQCIDWIAILGEGEKKGFIKFTGLNNANIEKINKDDLGFNRDWNIWDLNIFLISEPAKCRPSQNQKYPRPHLTFIKNKVEYSISKRCERIFEEPAATQSGYKIKPNVFQQYRAILNDYNEFSKKIEEDVRKNFCTIVIDKEINDGDLVYFHLDDSGEVDAIIPVCISRIADTKYLAERLPYDYEVLRPCVRDCLYEGRQCKTCSLVGFPEKMWFRVHEEGLCPACSLFGTQIYKGRGRFGFAWADHCKYIEAPITLDRLESPRPTWVIPGKNDLFKLPGRKFYLHHAGWKRECSENRQKELENKRNKNNATFQVLKEGTFHFKVFFENLDRWELGLLIFCLELGDNAFAHKMGHGKALGFGSIKIEVEGIKTRKGSGQFEEKDFDFKKETVKQGFAKFREWFPDTWKRHLNNFFQILYCPADKSPIIRYPALREKDDPQGFPGYEELKERREFSEEQRNTIFASPWVKWHQLN